MSRLARETRKSITRRQFIKKGAAAAIALLGLPALPFYSHYGERRWLRIERRELRFPDLPPSFDGVKIAQFSDVHYGFYYGSEELRGLVERIQGEAPDLIAFTGDLFDRDVMPFAEDCIRELRKLEAPLGKFAVPGNHDYYTGLSLVPRVLQESGFHVLLNRSEKLHADGGSIRIAGVDDMINGIPDFQASLSGAGSDLFTLLLVHEPDAALRTAGWRVDLQLSGHTHGGQVRLPLIGALMTVRGGKQFVDGLYELTDRAAPSYVYASRGVGTTHIPVRFLCRPEIAVFTLRRTAAKEGTYAG